MLLRNCETKRQLWNGAFVEAIDFSTERGAGGGRPTPALLTADFLDSLGSRLSSVRELLGSDQVRVVQKGKP